jgi:hypothetical protein
MEIVVTIRLSIVGKIRINAVINNPVRRRTDAKSVKGVIQLLQSIDDPGSARQCYSVLSALNKVGFDAPCFVRGNLREVFLDMTSQTFFGSDIDHITGAGKGQGD